MPGVFYRSPSPTEPSYVEEGDEIEEGQTLGLLEAMKTFNEIESPCYGIVQKILIGNEKEVTQNQVIIINLTGFFFAIVNFLDK